MDDNSKLIGENGCMFVDNSATTQDIYMITVLEAATFTVLTEGADKNAAGTDVMSDMNLTSKSIPAGAILTPYDEVFTSVTITAGSLMAYKLGK